MSTIQASINLHDLTDLRIWFLQKNLIQERRPGNLKNG